MVQPLWSSGHISTPGLCQIPRSVAYSRRLGSNIIGVGDRKSDAK